METWCGRGGSTEFWRETILQSSSLGGTHYERMPRIRGGSRKW